MKVINGNLQRNLFVSVFGIILTCLMGWGVWVTMMVYEIKTDVTIIKSRALDNDYEHTMIKDWIKENNRQIIANSNKIEEVKDIVNEYH